MDFKHKTKSRQWTNKEEQTAYKYYKQGYTLTEIANRLNRSPTSIKNKIRRLKKKRGVNNYDQDHTIDKHLTNQRFIRHIQPYSILDVFNAGNTQYNHIPVHITNDIDTRFKTTYHLDAMDLLLQEQDKKNKYDIVDLDPYGAVLKYLPYALPLTRKAIILTYGELLHKQYKRTDTVQQYGITTPEQLNLENLIKITIHLAIQNGVKIKPVIIKDYKYIGRVYYEIRENKNK